MPTVTIEPTFASWRRTARRLLASGVEPWDVGFDDGSLAFLPGIGGNDAPETPADEQLRVPRSFVKLAEVAADHRDADRWDFLYAMLWRVTRDPRVMADPTDDGVLRLTRMNAAIRRDVHKAHAFVRFRKVAGGSGDVGGHYVAFHRPDHHIVRRIAPFFRDRFGGMRWTILTPDASATWNGRVVSFGPGVESGAGIDADDLEAVWKTYYANVFNPARVKVRAMKAEMNVRHWATLPEAELIPDLLRDASRRAGTMVAATEVMARSAQVAGAAEWVPTSPTIATMREAVQRCRGCELCELDVTQAVFGEGPADARVVFVGEQPGDNEDRQGRPFVGPAGQLLDDLLDEAGVDRRAVYLTNTVKHFHHTKKGTFRLHQKPLARHVSACRPWLEAEVRVVRPDILVALGSTAAQAVMGRDFRVTQSRGEPMASPMCGWFIATIHPSAILRIPEDADRARAKADFVGDMRLVASRMREMGPPGGDTGL